MRSLELEFAGPTIAEAAPPWRNGTVPCATGRALPGRGPNFGRSRQFLHGMRCKLAPLDGNALVQFAGDMRLHRRAPFREYRHADDDLDQCVHPEIVFGLHERSA